MHSKIQYYSHQHPHYLISMRPLYHYNPTQSTNNNTTSKPHNTLTPQSPHHFHIPQPQQHIRHIKKIPFTILGQQTTPTIPINTITYIGYIRYNTHLHLKTPKIKLLQHYTWDNTTLITLSGDIESNPGPPLTHILKNLPREYTQRQKQYFIPNTLTLKSQYTHLEELFTSYLTQTTPDNNKQELAHLRRNNLPLSKYPIHHKIYALIITYSPIPYICDQQMANNLNPIYLTILRRLNNLTAHAHPQTQHLNHHTTTSAQITDIAQAYNHINMKIVKSEPTDITTLKQDLPYFQLQVI